jgi:FkbM family methyltransferase
VPESAPRIQCFRRDFLVGTAAGLAATLGAGRVMGDSTRFPANSTPSYSQCGEDVIVRLILEDLGIDLRSYLDVGAYLPIAYNNTYLFYSKGARGVLVEPNVDLIPKLKAGRPKDTVLNVGIGVTDQAAADYYCLTLPEWNTFDKDEAERAVGKSEGRVKIEKVVKMALVPINRIIEGHFHGKSPDYLSIDVEGMDLPILRTLDFQRFRPRVICTETPSLSTGRMVSETTEFLSGQGYAARAMTYANTIYLDENRPG